MENRINEIISTIERTIKQTEKQLQEERETLIRRLTDLDYHTTIHHGHSNTTEKIGKLALKLQMLHEQKEQLNYIING